MPFENTVTMPDQTFLFYQHARLLQNGKKSFDINVTSTSLQCVASKTNLKFAFVIIIFMTSSRFAYYCQYHFCVKLFYLQLIVEALIKVLRTRSCLFSERRKTGGTNFMTFYSIMESEIRVTVDSWP
jgi:hypothetical protein